MKLEEAKSIYLKHIRGISADNRYEEIFRILHRYQEEIGNIQIEKITSHGLTKQALLGIKVKYKLGDSSIYYCALIIKKFLIYCVSEGYINKKVDANIATNFKEFQLNHYNFFKKNTAIAVYPFDEEEMRNAWFSLEPSFLHLRNATIVNILFDTGMSVDELTSAQRSDFENGILIAKRYKRQVYLSEPTKIMLAGYLAKRKDKEPFLFMNLSSSTISCGLTDRSVERLVVATSRMVNSLVHITPNRIRQSKTAKLFASGLTRSKISKIMGYNFSTPQLSKFSSIDGAQLNSELDKNVNRYLEDFEKQNVLRAKYNVSAVGMLNSSKSEKVEKLEVSGQVFLRESDVLLYLNKLDAIYVGLIPIVLRMKEWGLSRDLFSKYAKNKPHDVRSIEKVLYINEFVTKQQFIGYIKLIQ